MIAPADEPRQTVGFIGLGLMGSAMAANLQATVPLIVWNRSHAASEALEASGARVATSAAAVFESASIVFVMLSDEAAIDAVIPFDGTIPLRGRVVVLMSTVAPAYSEHLAERVEKVGGAFVEAPVSGSRQPAIEGTLISMIAGADDALDRVEPLLRAMSSAVIRCGRPPAALKMKLAVNTFLITLVTGLAEAFHFAEENGVDPATLQTVLDAGPLASAVSRAKAAKIVAQDWSSHAAIPDVLKNSRLVCAQADRSGSASPLMDVCRALFEEAEALGHRQHDMAAVIEALRHRTDAARRSVRRA